VFLNSITLCSIR